MLSSRTTRDLKIMFYGEYIRYGSSTFQLNNVAFIRNKLWWSLLDIESNSGAIIQNSIILENNLSYVLYNIWYSSTIQLNYVAFTRNKLLILPNSKAIIQNNTLVENKFSRIVLYDILFSTRFGTTFSIIFSTILENMKRIVY